ncbi:uncharacterized protein MELLADRAFT_85813 [Melampsora larici-populina 98AG31]|uniref:Uncharacterized protein n=1 Tax=Melampsora larici-populina (strain 98AG31 / pathotype 3-4-7) TaxID=747676 RepID=F4RJV7_MELLP|nr:uncharacterized protein MELLADRAFT_85813 [Melampsora larici-populina 98AG31]EGG07379.1 hypothetical protein MELLADRAFT_85813 [Melampsora larici-populina 98AG31]
MSGLRLRTIGTYDLFSVRCSICLFGPMAKEIIIYHDTRSYHFLLSKRCQREMCLLHLTGSMEWKPYISEKRPFFF